ncbi:MAG: deoxyribose-phosphate aldolase [Candidatus Dormibacteraeota bacterium]|nr:deoxyribose-phosphate aldolase [Candidatus Dormibacteraeota bacterium]
MSDLAAGLVRTRVTSPAAIAEALARRSCRDHVTEGTGTLFLIAADHPARGQLTIGADRLAMADRGDLLRRLLLALGRPGVDGVMATADIVEDLALLGALEDKVVFGSMNRGGLAGSCFELDDGFTGYTAAAIARDRLDGGKMMVRIDDQDPGTLRTLEGCARAIDELAAFRLPALLEVFPVRREGGGVRAVRDPSAMARAITIVSGLGGTSAYTWLKLPVGEDMDEVLAATTLPTFLLGGDPGKGAEVPFARWERAMGYPQVRGLVAGRALLYPADGDVAHAVDQAAAIVDARRRSMREAG